MNSIDPNDSRRQLIQDGYCLFRNVLDENMMARLRQTTSRLVDEQTEEEKTLHRSTGSMISVVKDPLFAELISHPGALEALRSLGFPGPKFYSGYIISKPPQCPRLFWHYDFPIWDEPGAFGEVPLQLFLMYYLVDTTPKNGCLRVIPGSHLRDNPLHTELEEAHSRKLLRAEDPDSAAFASRPDEVDVPVRAGDLLVGDARLLHASHANLSNEYRTVITLWYNPDFSALSERGKAFYNGIKTLPPEDWPNEALELLEPLWVNYEGGVEPLPWNRKRPIRGGA